MAQTLNNDGDNINIYNKDEPQKSKSIDTTVVSKAIELIQSLTAELVEKDNFEGLSYLNMKNDTLLSYMIDLCNILLRKVRGQSIVGHSSVERCVEYRVILEKIKAIDMRLAYQLNKLITMPDNATEEDQRVNVANLDIQIESAEEESDDEGSSHDKDPHNDGDEREEVEEGDEDDDDDDDSADDEDISDDGGEVESKPEPRSVGIYKPPKLRSVVYIENKGSQARRKDYNEFYQEDEMGDIIDETHHREDEDRKRFEEENYTRLPSERKSKRKFNRAKNNKRLKSNKRRK